MKYLLLIILGAIASCNSVDEIKQDYMNQCQSYIERYFDSHKLEHVTLTSKQKNDICQCGFEKVENNFRRNRGEIKTDKMYWSPLEECLVNGLK